MQEASNLLKTDIEQLGVKFNTNSELQKISSNKNHQIDNNKSIFKFNDTDNSICQSQKFSDTNDPIKEILKQEINNMEENDLNVKPSDKTDIEIGMKKLKLVDDIALNQEIPAVDLSAHSTLLLSNSFVDNQFMLKAAETFEKDNSKEPLKCLNSISFDKDSINLNNTIVSQDVLKMCEIFEKNMSTTKKPKKGKSSKVQKHTQFFFWGSNAQKYS